MLLCRQVLGNAHVLRLDAPHLLSPPPGFHSVLGEKGLHLNYSESVLYNDDAIRPAYILIYKLPTPAPKPPKPNKKSTVDEALASAAASKLSWDDIYTEVKDPTKRDTFDEVSYYTANMNSEWDEYSVGTTMAVVDATTGAGVDPTGATDWQSSYVYDEPDDFPDLYGGTSSYHMTNPVSTEGWNDEAF
jgi:hypothetical protein